MFESRSYEVRQRISIGNKYRIYEDDEPILESAQKKFRLKEDFRFTDPDTDEELFRVKADSMLDVAAAYDIVDARTGERVGAVKREAISVFKHEYTLLGPDGDVVASVREDNVALAVARRLLTTLIPFSYEIVTPDGQTVGEANEAFSLRDKYSIDLYGDDVDPRLAVVGMVVIDAIEAN
ncbi:MAG: LURP-one-related/scramblase family protein [Haloquadratum sp.]